MDGALRDSGRMGRRVFLGKVSAAAAAAVALGQVGRAAENQATEGPMPTIQLGSGKRQQVHDFVKKVHDAGMLAGVSTHNPDNVQRIADEGWETDLFMACFYYINRPREEQEKLLGKVVVHEPYFESDPIDMTKVIRQVKQPCLGFKILAAGRLCWSKPSLHRAFKFAFSNIKPIDGVIVGMFPRYSDEVGEDAQCARTFGSSRNAASTA
jgi:hypothetical protein